MSFVIWLTGPSGAGKTVLAQALEKKLRGMDYRAEVLDGDTVRHKLYPDIGFSEEARKMHNRVVIHMAKLLSRNEVVAIVSLISPYRETRNYARQELSKFIEVYLRCPLDVRIQRDPKGLYTKAIRGEIKGLTGYDGIYEEPENPEVILDTHRMSVDQEADLVMDKAAKFGYL